MQVTGAAGPEFTLRLQAGTGDMFNESETAAVTNQERLRLLTVNIRAHLICGLVHLAWWEGQIKWQEDMAFVALK